MKGVFLLAVFLVLVPVQASAEWRCPRGSKLVQQLYAGGMLMEAEGPTCIEKRSLRSKSLPRPPACDTGSFAYYSSDMWSCVSQSAGAPSGLAPGSMTGCGMIGQPPCGGAQPGGTAPAAGGGSTSGSGGGGSLWDYNSSPPMTSTPAPSVYSAQPPVSPAYCPFLSTRVQDNPLVCIVNYNQLIHYPPPPSCPPPQYALYDSNWGCAQP